MGEKVGMDILYVVKGDSLALRYSLRSVERFASNVGRVVVAGTWLPVWLRNVETVEVPSPHDHKQKNILHAILETMRRGVVDGPCLYSSDDHFLVADCDFDDYPWFCRGAEAPNENPGGWHFVQSIKDTEKLLKGCGMWPGVRVDGHWNTHLDARDREAVEDMAKNWEGTLWGYEPSTLFIAAAKARDPSIELTPRMDCKLSSDSVPFGGFWGMEGGTLSVSDLAGLPLVTTLLDTMFHEPCRYEDPYSWEGLTS